MAQTPKKPQKPAQKSPQKSTPSARRPRQTAARDLAVNAEEARRIERALRAKQQAAPDDLDDADLDAYQDDEDDDDEVDADADDGDDAWDDGDDDETDADADDDNADAADDDDASYESYESYEEYAPFPAQPVTASERLFMNKLYADMPAVPKPRAPQVSGWLDLGQTRDPKTGKVLYPQYRGWAIRVRKNLPLDWMEAAQELHQRSLAARRDKRNIAAQRISISTVRTLVSRAVIAWNFPDEFGQPLARPPLGIGSLDNDLLAATFATAVRALRAPKAPSQR